MAGDVAIRPPKPSPSGEGGFKAANPLAALKPDEGQCTSRPSPPFVS